MRNPENIDLVKYPPPAGYVVASGADIIAAGGKVPDGWMYWEGRWVNHYDPGETRRDPFNVRWTYLRPAFTRRPIPGMKITITIECEPDGPVPTIQDVTDAVAKIIPQMFVSESIGKPDEWAVMVNEWEIGVE